MGKKLIQMRKGIIDVSLFIGYMCFFFITVSFLGEKEKGRDIDIGIL